MSGSTVVVKSMISLNFTIYHGGKNGGLEIMRKPMTDTAGLNDDG